MQAYRFDTEFSFFSDADKQFKQLISALMSDMCMQCEHGDVEELIRREGNEVMRLLLQAYLDKKAADEDIRHDIESVDGVRLNHIRHDTTRTITTLFGNVRETRKGYSQRRQNSVFPMDRALNLADDQYSDGLRFRVAQEAIKGSFDQTGETIKQTTGGSVPKRQCLNVVEDIAQDFDTFYEQKASGEGGETDNLLVITLDGKGIIMRPGSLRECTKKAARKEQKLNSRLSQGEKKNRKRMAQVAAVYSVKPHVRTASDIMGQSTTEDPVLPFTPPAVNKRVWASVEKDSETVIEEAFQEALRRDPQQQRQWVVLVDGQPQQLRSINNVMKRLNVSATIVMDFIHVLEYLWLAAWCFFDKGDPDVEAWISERATKILQGKCSQVAKGLRISATKQALTKRDGVEKCAKYLIKNKTRLQYDVALTEGFPIASGVIEGACRHLINDRLDITGARWSLRGAESILKLRALNSSGDLQTYYQYHKQQSKLRLYG